MKVFIVYQFSHGPWGGGNQFLKALHKQLEREHRIADHPSQADLILFNSHHNLDQVISLKHQYPHKKFIHRVDGPISLVRGSDNRWDVLLTIINKYIADGTIYQTNWSKKQLKKLTHIDSPLETTIINAPDPGIFSPKSTKPHQPFRIIISSFSSNLNKGFATYKYIDENLDQTQYQCTFVGNSPFPFRHIVTKPAMPTHQLAKELRQHDAFLTASINDPCSNALIEALHSGLPAIALNSGGHPEIVGSGGVMFDDKQEIFEKIKQLKKDYTKYQKGIQVPDIHEVTHQYHEFFNQVVVSKLTKPKLSLISKIYLISKTYTQTINYKINKTISRWT